MSAAVDVRGIELRRYNELFERLSDPSHRRELLHSLGAIVESQTRRRISDEKEDPNGVPWQTWSQGYEKTRHGNQSLLQNNGDLLDSITNVVGSNSVKVGSPLTYARVHQEGFSGVVNVSAHTRRASQVFGRVLSSPVSQSVGAFTRNMNIPQRQFLGISRENEREVYSVVGDFINDLMRV